MGFLPTPVADNSRGLPQTGTDFQSLPNILIGLPTPTSRDWKGHNQRADDTCLTGALLPTPRAQNGEPRNQNIYARPADQPQNLENALHGVITAPQSPDGSTSSDDPHQPQLSWDVQGIPA
jgi:hypothetical protein